MRNVSEGLRKLRTTQPIALCLEDGLDKRQPGAIYAAYT